MTTRFSIAVALAGMMGVVGVVGVGAALPGCSASRHAGAGMTATETATAVTVPVELDEFAIRMPSEFPSGNVVFEIKNTGAKEHTFKISGNGVSAELPDALGPGQSATLQVVLEPGRYKVKSPMRAQALLGMRRTVMVKETTT